MPCSVPFQWRIHGAVPYRLCYLRENMVKCSLGCLSSEECDVVPYRLIYVQEIMMKCPLGCPSNGENVMQCPGGSATCKKMR